MRQTSRAVALLLALDSTQAAAVNFPTNALNLFNAGVYPTQLLVPMGGPNFELAGALASRTAPYNNCPGWVQNAASATQNCPIANTNEASGTMNWGATYATQACTAGDIQAATVADTASTIGSFCVPCIQQMGNWCSRTFSYALINTATLYQFNSTANSNKDRIMSNIWTAANTAVDNGSCCGSRIDMTKQGYDIGGGVKTAAITAAANDASLNKWNKYACVAWSNGQEQPGNASTATTKMNSQAMAGAATQTTATRYSWWCSNGFYNAIQDAASSTAYTPNVKQALPDNANQRFELALVGCPQLAKSCGVALTDCDSAPTAGTILKLNVATFTTKDKCTFVGYGKTNPPAFTIDKAKGTGSTTAGINANSSWTIHHMEYNNAQLTEQASIDFQTTTQALDITSKVPQFTMKYTFYSKQRTWYGAGATVYSHDNWNAPYQNGAAVDATGYNGKQWYGSVANFASSVAGTDFTNASTNAVFDMRVIRYLPLQVALNDNAMGTAVATTYNTNKTTYDSAKTMWNNYVAILTKNSKVDAFAAAFAPPKAPTVPPLPNMPWMPDVSKTLQRLSTSKTLSQIGNSGAAVITAALQPATNDFWINDESVPLATGGGWGSFTAAVLTFRSGWGKSFGTIGYESSTANASFSAMGAVYTPAWQCATTTGGTGACPSVYTGVSISAAGTATTTVVANTKKFYVAVSLWSTKNPSTSYQNYTFDAACDQATNTHGSCFQITWMKGTWSTAYMAVAAPAAMTAATAADALTGIVGAQALAASAAAALATAAALY